MNDPYEPENNEQNQEIEEGEFDVENLIESDEEIVSDPEEGEITEEEQEENFSEMSENEGNSPQNIIDSEINIESEEEEEEEEETFKKFDNELKKNYILEQHPEIISHNNHEINLLSQVTRNKNGIIIDKLHRTFPILTKYERTKILGIRAKQINENSSVYVDVPPHIIDGYTIALMELEQKKIPFIIRRPLPNGNFEYWHINDLEQISY